MLRSYEFTHQALSVYFHAYSSPKTGPTFREYALVPQSRILFIITMAECAAMVLCHLGPS